MILQSNSRENSLELIECNSNNIFLFFSDMRGTAKRLIPCR